ncbi:NADH dehydrogenase [ubiquinone] 1 subunit C2 [Culicoides brevitarsis]|uniref:NADH dehydrogenase [ubiquinone] 1 subunit C2 n=1 Tax=Culicoides brevitarsis TaxID=469753 RepID=UPI00307B7AC6
MSDLSRDPVELLTNPGLKEPWMSNKIMAMGTGAAGFIFACYSNYGLKRPVFSGIQRHVAYTIVGAAIGQYLEHRRKEYYAKKDAVMRHFIELHPDDFPRFERKKLKDVIEPWIPIR